MLSSSLDLSAYEFKFLTLNWVGQQRKTWNIFYKWISKLFSDSRRRHWQEITHSTPSLDREHFLAGEVVLQQSLYTALHWCSNFLQDWQGLSCFNPPPLLKSSLEEAHSEQILEHAHPGRKYALPFWCTGIGTGVYGRWKEVREDTAHNANEISGINLILYSQKAFTEHI